MDESTKEKNLDISILEISSILKKKIRIRTAENLKKLWSYFEKTLFFIKLDVSFGRTFAIQCAERLLLMTLKGQPDYKSEKHSISQQQEDKKCIAEISMKSNISFEQDQSQKIQFHILQDQIQSKLNSLLKEGNCKQFLAGTESKQYLSFNTIDEIEGIILLSGNIEMKNNDHLSRIKRGENMKELSGIQLCSECEFAVLPSKYYQKIFKDREREQKMKRIGLMYQCGLFNHCKIEELQSLIKEDGSQEIHFTYNQVVYNEQQEVDGIYIILSGSFSITKTIHSNNTEKDISVAELSQFGGVFGQEELYLKQSLRSHRVVASSGSSVALFLHLKDFQRLLLDANGSNQIATAQMNNRENVVQSREQLEQSFFSSFLLQKKKIKLKKYASILPKSLENAKQQINFNSGNEKKQFEIVADVQQKKCRTQTQTEASENEESKNISPRSLNPNINKIESPSSGTLPPLAWNSNKQAKQQKIKYEKKEECGSEAIYSPNKQPQEVLEKQKRNKNGLNEVFEIRRKVKLGNFEQILTQDSSLIWKGGIFDIYMQARSQRIQISRTPSPPQIIPRYQIKKSQFKIFNKVVELPEKDSQIGSFVDNREKSVSLKSKSVQDNSSDSQTSKIESHFNSKVSLISEFKPLNPNRLPAKSMSPVESPNLKQDSWKQYLQQDVEIETKQIKQLPIHSNQAKYPKKQLNRDRYSQSLSKQPSFELKSKSVNSISPETISLTNILTPTKLNSSSFVDSLQIISVEKNQFHNKNYNLNQQRDKFQNNQVNQIEQFYGKNIVRKPLHISSSNSSLFPPPTSRKVTPEYQILVAQYYPVKGKCKQYSNSSSLTKDKLKNLELKRQLYNEKIEKISKGVSKQLVKNKIQQNLQLANYTEPNPIISLELEFENTSKDESFPTISRDSATRPNGVNKQFLRKARKKIKEKLLTAKIEKRVDKTINLLKEWEKNQSNKQKKNCLDILPNPEDKFPEEQISFYGKYTSPEKDKASNQSSSIQEQSLPSQVKLQGKEEQIFLRQIMKNKDKKVIHRISIQGMGQKSPELC